MEINIVSHWSHLWYFFASTFHDSQLRRGRGTRCDNNDSNFDTMGAARSMGATRNPEENKKASEKMSPRLDIIKVYYFSYFSTFMVLPLASLTIITPL